MNPARRWILALVTLSLALFVATGCQSGATGERSAWRQVQSAGAAQHSLGFGGFAAPSDRGGNGGARWFSTDTPGVDELWVIQRSPQRAPDTGAAAEAPGTGSLVCEWPGSTAPVPVPLEQTDVRASITGFLATTEVTQRFHNPFDTKIEALYVFPLPESAAINEFVMTIGDRRIRGVIREREQAEQVYREARAAGHVASLLTQERPNIFTQAVANIEPGKRIDVSIRYYHALAYDDGWLEYVFPMVVGPRFNPSGSTSGVGAVPRGEHGASGQETEVGYLAPRERSGHDISLAVELDAAMPTEEIRCATHRTEIDRRSGSRAIVRLSQLDSIPNKDFVLRFRIAGEEPRSMLLTHRAADGGGYFALMLVPPMDLREAPRHPVEMIFVLDCSGSMSGEPLAQAKNAVSHAISLLRPQDSFQIIRFSDRSSAMGRDPVPATGENVRTAGRYLDSLTGEGGTMMIDGIRAALSARRDDHRLRYVTFLTDGYIGNETEVLMEMRRLIGPARVFSFGVGSSPNRYLMDAMARLGRGAAAYLGPRDDGAEVMDRFFARASRPALTGLGVDWQGCDVFDILPSRPGAALGDSGAADLPDMFTGRPLVVTGRFRGQTPRRIVVEGRSGNSPVRIVTSAGAAAAERPLPALAQIWARHKIGELGDQAIVAQKPVPAAEVRRLALSHGLLSAFTAFIAVDAATVTGGDHGVTVPIPVPVPEGVRYETTVTRSPRDAAGDVD